MDTETIVRFEVARDIIGNMIALLTGDLATEASRPNPDRQKIQQMRETRGALAAERRTLGSSDLVDITRIFDTYAPIVRARVDTVAPH